MSSQILTALLVVFVLGLFVGTNLGVFVMCLLQMSKSDYADDGQRVPVSVHTEG